MKSKWEKEFDKKFGRGTKYFYLAYEQRDLGEERQGVKSFIRQLLSEERKRLSKWLIKQELTEPDCHQSHRDLVAGYNQALLKVRQKLNSPEEKEEK